MKQVFRYNADGFYIEPVILQDGEPIPNDCTEKQPPDGLFKGQLVNDDWVESLSTDEINSLKNVTPSPYGTDELQKQITDLSFALMLKGVL